MNKVAHYNGFVGRCQQYGLTKAAADMLYKKAGVESMLTNALTQAVLKNPSRAEYLASSVKGLLAQRAYGNALKPSLKTIRGTLKAMKPTVDKHEAFMKTPAIDYLSHRLARGYRPDAPISTKSLKNLHLELPWEDKVGPSRGYTRLVTNELREALGKPLREEIF